MNAYLDLRRLLAASSASITGEVLERVGADRYRVRSSRGTIEAAAVGGVAFVAGDEVMVRDGVIMGRVKSAASVRSYTV